MANLSAAGEAHEVSLLFADIHGFTALAEQMSPREVVSLLNEHFAQMAEIVFFHGGVLDKFLGDAVHGGWGVTERSPLSPRRAVRAALEMQQRVGDMNALRAAAGKPQFEIGIGVHTGWVVFGAMGSARRQDYTVLGDTVATAFKLAGAAGAGQVVASEVTLSATQGAFAAEELAGLGLTGRAAGLRAFRVREEAEGLTGRAGRRTSMRVPRSGALSTAMAPPCAVTMPCTTDSPRPVPWPTSLVV